MKILALYLLTLTLFAINRYNWALSHVDTESQKERGEKCEVHFHFKLVSQSGEWESYVHYASEDGTAVMPDDDCKKVTWFEDDTEAKTIQIQQAMTVDTDNSIILGHQNGKYKDFFSVLTVTMTQMPNNALPLREKLNDGSESLATHDTALSPPPKMCVFYIGASAPGEPVLYSHGFHNATCVLDPDTYTLTSK